MKVMGLRMKSQNQNVNTCVWMRSDFHQRPEIKYLRRQANGVALVVLYQWIVEESLAYEEGILPSDIFYRKTEDNQFQVFGKDLIEKGLVLLSKLELIEIYRDGRIYVPNQPFIFRGNDKDNPNKRRRYNE